MPPNKVLLNPGNYELFGWDQIKGVPVEPSDQVPPERFRIDCDGSANGIEEAMEQFMPAPQEVPQVVPVGPSGPFETPFRPSVDDLDDLPIDPFRW
ncbi:MAG: hypothetical protein JHC87_09280 [Thermoleophilaceae bacterium]|nr:hypothetical protein [Thermoleophilaceae bacterium]